MSALCSASLNINHRSFLLNCVSVTLAREGAGRAMYTSHGEKIRKNEQRNSFLADVH